MRALVAGLLFSAAPLLASPEPPPTLKSILLEQFKTTHNDQDWFVPASKAVEGMTAEQARGRTATRIIRSRSW